MSLPHSALTQMAYQDLLQLLQDEPGSGIIGNPHKVLRNGRGYWYDMYRLGTAVKNRYLGEDSPEMAARIADHKRRAAQQKASAAEGSRLVRVLRAEGVATTDRETGALLAALEKSGLFRLGCILAGTHAFRAYQAELGIRYSAETLAQAGGVDLVAADRLSLVLADPADPQLAAAFRGLEFLPGPDRFAASVWRWKHAATNGMVEFLTASVDLEEAIRPLPALGVAVQPLPYLTYLSADPIKAALLYRSGILVQIPRPERYALHKLIVANRRGGPEDATARKDHAQAAFLIRALVQTRPDDLRKAFAEALALGPDCSAHIDASLSDMPQTAALLAPLDPRPKPAPARRPPPQDSAQFSFDF